MLYLQNGNLIVSIDSVTSLLPMYKMFRQRRCSCVYSDNRRRLCECPARRVRTSNTTWSTLAKLPPLVLVWYPRHFWRSQLVHIAISLLPCQMWKQPVFLVGLHILLPGPSRLFTDTSEYIRFLLFIFSLFYFFSCWFRAVDSVDLCHSFWAHVEIASSIVSYRWSVRTNINMEGWYSHLNTPARRRHLLV